MSYIQPMSGFFVFHLFYSFHIVCSLAGVDGALICIASADLSRLLPKTKLYPIILSSILQNQNKDGNDVLSVFPLLFLLSDILETVIIKAPYHLWFQVLE